MKAYYEQYDTVCLALIKALEEGLGVYEGCVSKRYVPSDTDLRLNHYPAIPLKEITSGNQIGIASHVDFDVIALLFQNGVGELEVENRFKPSLDFFVFFFVCRRHRDNHHFQSFRSYNATVNKRSVAWRSSQSRHVRGAERD